MSETSAIRFVEETGSTNADLAAELRGENPPQEGDWLVAKRQTAGRGRQGREWFDGTGNFMGSTVVTLRDGDPPPATLAFVAALAVERAVSSSLEGQGEVKLKWPNDVLLGDGKLSGILLELVGRSVVIGIGVNLAKAPDLPDRKTAALSDVQPGITPLRFTANLSSQTELLLDEWRAKPLPSLLDAFLERSIHEIGSPVTVHDTDGSRIEGTFAGLDETDGALRLRLADGSERVIRAGDIT